MKTKKHIFAALCCLTALALFSGCATTGEDRAPIVTEDKSELGEAEATMIATFAAKLFWFWVQDKKAEREAEAEPLQSAAPEIDLSFWGWLTKPETRAWCRNYYSYRDGLPIDQQYALDVETYESKSTMDGKWRKGIQHMLANPEPLSSEIAAHFAAQ